MEFDRKTGTHSGETAEGKTAFAELPRLLDAEEAPAQAAAGNQHKAEELYSPGAFPALDIAYPRHNMRGGAGVFPLDNRRDNINYSGRQNQGRVSEEGPAGQPLRQMQTPPVAGPGGQSDSAAANGRPRQNRADSGPAWSEQAMAERRYPDRNGQGGYGGGHNAAPYAPAPQMADSYGRRQADFAPPETRIPAGGYQEEFQQDDFRGGLGGEGGLQPAYFDPSDYDYNYDPAAEAESARQAEAERAEAERQASAYANAYSERRAAPPQQQNYAPPQAEQRPGYYARPYEAAPLQPDYAAPQNAYAPAPAPAYEPEYPAYAEEGEGYYPEPQADYGYAAPPPGAENETYGRTEYSSYPAEEGSGYQPAAEFYGAAPAADNAPAYADKGGAYAAAQNYGGQQDYSREDDYGHAAPPPGGGQSGYHPEGGFAAAPPVSAPYGGGDSAFEPPLYADEHAPLAEDFGRLEGDVSEMDQLAGPFPPVTDERPAAPQSFAPAGAAEPQRRQRQNRPPAAAQRNAAAEPEVFFPPQDEAELTAVNNGRAADSGENFADAAYSDELYDWAPAPVTAAAPAPQAHRAAAQPQPQKSRRLLYILIAAIVIIAGGAGVYLKYGHSLAGSGEPVVIRKSESDYKIKAETKTAGKDTQEQSVSEGVNGAAAGSQKTLIDKTETPVEAQKMEERLPFSDEQGKFDQSAADSLVNMAVAQATPVHIVPSVKVDADRKVTASSAAGEKVLIPALAAGAAQSAPAQPAAALPRAAPARSAAEAEPPAQPKPAAAKAEKVMQAAAAPRQAAQPAEPAKQSAPKAAAPAKSAAASGGGFSMQISSQPSKEAAEASLRAAKKHLSPDLADKIMIVPATIEGKSYYRVRIPAGSREEAAAMCEEYKQAGGRCFIAR